MRRDDVGQGNWVLAGGPWEAAPGQTQMQWTDDEDCKTRCYRVEVLVPDLGFWREQLHFDANSQGVDSGGKVVRKNSDVYRVCLYQSYTWAASYPDRDARS